jgi:hypothetical protein
MPDSAPADYITKTEAARLYRRSERSISRDITNAVKFGDQRLLKHVELRLEDGSRRAGTELTIEEIVDLRDRGLNPTWMLQTLWLRSAYGRRDEPAVRDSRIPDFPTSSETPAAEQQPLPEDLDQRVAVLTAQNDALRQTNVDLRSQTERLEKELDRRAEERREENELQKQNNVLMQQVYNLLSRMQDSTGPISVLPAPRTAPSSTEPSVPVNAEPSADRKGSQTDPRKPAAATKSIRKQTASKARHVRTNKEALPPETQPPEDILHRWFPTFLGSSRRRNK